MLINGYEVQVEVENKNKRYTLLSIHGMNSSMSFISSLDRTPNNFNHIKITLPQKGNLSVEQLNGIVSTIINDHITTHHLVLLGHSLGAVQALYNFDNPKVRKTIFVSPLNPSALTPKKKLLLESAFGAGKVGASVNRWFEKHDKSKEGILTPILDPHRPFRGIFTEDVLNPRFMAELDSKYKANNKPSLYIVGNLDVFIDPKELDSYLKTFGKKLHIVRGGHNPFRYDPKTTKLIINEFIPNRNRLIKKEIWKK